VLAAPYAAYSTTCYRPLDTIIGYSSQYKGWLEDFCNEKMEKGGMVSILYVGTFPPRACGIATFTKDLTDTMDEKFRPLLKSEVLAINDNEARYNYNDKVKFQLDETDVDAYIRLAREINNSDAIKIVNIQHEFGIFGGENGGHILYFLDTIKKPVVITLHTVEANPDEHKKRLVQSIASYCSAVVVMAKEAVRILREDYEIKNAKIFFIPHGVPSVPFNPKYPKEKIGLKNKTIISTFGLLNRGKGIEYVLKALPSVVEKFPNIVYIIIGETHPIVRKKEGESYRDELKEIVKDLGLEKHVVFYNKYLTSNELIEYLCATDVYIAPALDKNQIVSGTLSYALGCGKAIISTPTIYAKEVLSQKRGVLVEFKNPDSIAKALIDVLSDGQLKGTLEKNAYEYGSRMVWSNVASSYLEIFNEVANLIPQYPPIKLDHLISLTDDAGVMQHAKHTIPIRKEGYTTDDNARALIVAAKHYDLLKSKSSLKLINTSLSFLHFAQKEDGKFHNFMSYGRSFLDKEGSEDSFGRVLQACGYIISSKIHKNTKATAKYIFDNASKWVTRLNSPRAKAFTIIGLYYYFKEYKHEDIVDKIKILADSLVKLYETNASQDWKWFEPYLTYSNSSLPESLFLAYSITKNESYLKTAQESLDFLSEVAIVDGKLMPIGNKGWYNKDGKRAFYDQQPIDVGVMVQTYLVAHEIAKEDRYYENAILAFNWFLGKNSLNQWVYDETTGGCFDGISPHGVNLNQGAESTLTYLLARLCLEEVIFFK